MILFMAGEFSHIEGLIFDFDGILIDSYAAHLKAWKATFGHFGLDFDEDEFRSCFSPDWYQVYQAMGLARRYWNAADSFWLKAAANHTPQAFPGAQEALKGLGQDYALAIVTGGSRQRVVQDLERISLSEFFSALVASEDMPRPKPAPDGLQMALDQLGLESPQALYVGDARADLEMARGLEMTFIGVDGPFRERAFDQDQLVLPSVAELPGLLRKEAGGFRKESGIRSQESGRMGKGEASGIRRRQEAGRRGGEGFRD